MDRLKQFVFTPTNYLNTKFRKIKIILSSSGFKLGQQKEDGHITSVTSPNRHYVDIEYINPMSSVAREASGPILTSTARRFVCQSVYVARFRPNALTNRHEICFEDTLQVFRTSFKREDGKASVTSQIHQSTRTSHVHLCTE